MLTRCIWRVLYDEASQRWRVVSDTGTVLAEFAGEWQAWAWIDARSEARLRRLAEEAK